MSEDRSKLIMTTQIAESAERYQDMAVAMKKVTEMGGLLTEDERNYLSVAYKNVVGSKRSSWRTLDNITVKVKESGNEDRLALTSDYKAKVEKELKDICSEVLDLLTKFLIPNAESARKTEEDESAKGDLLKACVFYLKMKGDYYRYLAEIDKANDSYKNDSEASYRAAYDLCCADDGMEATNPIRLGLALNFSVFYYEIRGQEKEACELAKKAFDDAIAKLDSLSEDSYKDSTLIMQLLRDNLTLWTSTENPDEQNGS